jgi:hypothetical protein
MNIGERFALGKCHFDDGDYAKALNTSPPCSRRTRNTTKANSPACCCGSTPSRSSTMPARSSKCSRSCANASHRWRFPSTASWSSARPTGHRRTRARLAGLPRRHQRQFFQRRGHQRRARGRGPLPRLHRFPGTRLARIPGHRRGGLSLFRPLAAALSESAHGPRAAEGGRCAAGENRHAQAHRGLLLLPRPLSRPTRWPTTPGFSLCNACST